MSSLAPIAVREEQFRRHAEHALANLSGPDAVEAVVQLYRADTGALNARLEALVMESTNCARDARQQHAMLEQAHGHAARVGWTNATMAAEIAGLRHIVEQTRALISVADDEKIAVMDLAAVLATEPLAPVHLPSIIAFLPSERWRSGTFVTHDRAVTLSYVFVGYGLVDYGPGRRGLIEPMFLVEDRVLPKSVVENERSVELEQLHLAMEQRLLSA